LRDVNSLRHGVGRKARRLAFLAADFKRHHFVFESSRLNRGFRFLLRPQCKLVLFLARDFVLTGQLLGRLAHQQSGKRIAEAVAVHAIDELHVAHARAPSRTFGEIRHARHALRSAGQNCICTTEHDLLRRQNDCFQS